MTAKVITVTNQKGGAGKSTLTMQIAGAFATDKKVMVIDADPQATASTTGPRSSHIPAPAAKACRPE